MVYGYGMTGIYPLYEWSGIIGNSDIVLSDPIAMQTKFGSSTLSLVEFNSPFTSSTVHLLDWQYIKGSSNVSLVNLTTRLKSTSSRLVLANGSAISSSSDMSLVTPGSVFGASTLNFVRFGSSYGSSSIKFASLPVFILSSSNVILRSLVSAARFTSSYIELAERIRKRLGASNINLTIEGYEVFRLGIRKIGDPCSGFN